MTMHFPAGPSDDRIRTQGDSLRVSLGALAGFTSPAQCLAFLDVSLPLAGGSHRDATGYLQHEGQLVVLLEDEIWTTLAWPDQFLCHRGPNRAPERIDVAVRGRILSLMFNRGPFLPGELAPRLRDIALQGVTPEEGKRFLDELAHRPVSRRIHPLDNAGAVCAQDIDRS